jgi:hypothetical protein
MLVNSSRFSSSSRSRLLNDSPYAFSHGAPGAMYSVCTPERGSQSRFARDRLVEGLVGHQLLEPGVFALQLLESPGVVGLHAAVLVAPAVECRLGDPQLLADGRDRLAGGQFGVGLPELVNDLLGGVTLPSHRESPPPAAATPRPGHGLS